MLPPGRNGGLSVAVKSYDPSVKCVTEMPFDDHGQCSKLLGTMLYSEQKYHFTRSERSAARSVSIPEGGFKITNSESHRVHACLYKLLPRQHCTG